MLYHRISILHTNIFRNKDSKLPVMVRCFEIFPYLALFLVSIYPIKDDEKRSYYLHHHHGVDCNS